MDCEENPTPAEIRRLCKEIQANWSQAEHRRRAPWYYEEKQVNFTECDRPDEGGEE